MRPWLVILALPALLSAQPDRSRACASCHREIWESYRQTGMGRSFSRATPANTPTGTYFHEPSQSYFSVLARDGRMIQRRHQLNPAGEPINIFEKPIDYVMGSGNHARTFLYRAPTNGLFELPLGWYAEKGGYLAMNPGYDRPDHDGFRRPITYDCMFCHNAYPQIAAVHEKPFADSVYPSALPEGIDCERCHGPGSRHMQLAGTRAAPSAVRQAIVNPARLSADRQLDLCMACHLESTSFPLPNAIQRYGRGPFSFRPGEPLADFLLNFDHAPGAGREDKFEIVSAAYRLRKSACFTQSAGKLLCTTCHNPHQTKQNSPNASCQNCHGSLTKSAVHATAANCIECHMPKRRTEDVIHVAVTDHYIQRRKPPGDLLAERSEHREPYRGAVVPYYPAQLPPTPESELYLAVAQVKQKSNLAAGLAQLQQAMAQHKPTRAEWYIELGDALDSDPQPYREALRRDPASPVALHKLGSALRRRGQLLEAVAVLRRAPRRAITDHELALAYRALGRPAEAVQALQSALALDPDLPEAHNNLGILQLSEASFRQAIRIKPDYADAHANLAQLLAANSRLAEAEAEFVISLRLRPADAAARYNYALLLGRTQRYTDAQRELEACLGHEPKFAPAHLLLGELLSARGLVAQAIPHLEQAMADPQTRSAAGELLRQLRTRR